MRIAKLLDEFERPVPEPVAVQGSVSFDAREGVAQAWAAGGRTLIAEMDKARVVWMGSAGTVLKTWSRLTGQIAPSTELRNGSRFTPTDTGDES